MNLKHPINMSSTEFANNTHATFRWMRANAPVYKARLTRWKKAYLLTRYEDVAMALQDPRLAKDANNARTKSGRSGNIWMPKTFRPLMHSMLNADMPDHRRLRNLVHKAFTPRMIRQLAPRIEAITHDLLDKAHQKSEVDLIRDFALPLPVTVIAEMIGIPEADREQFFDWTKQMMVNPSPLNMLKAVPAVTRILKYFRKLAAQRRANPQDDLLTALALAEDAGDMLTEDELLGTLFVLLVAGHETTVSLIANGALALLTHPEQLDLLRGDMSQVETAVEEFLRFDGPLQTSEMYFAREPITLHDVAMPQGSIILPSILSANRDEAVFENADQLDITRKPNKHLAFGQGIHYCLGAPLARLEGKIAFRALLERSPNLRLNGSVADLSYKSFMVLHRLNELPVLL